MIGYLFLICATGIVSSASAIEESPMMQKEYYLECNLRANWFKALFYCRSKGMELASVTTEEEQRVLNTIISDAGVKSKVFWLGGTDLGENGQFSWVSSGSPITYTNWQSTEPNNPGSCIELWTDQRWVDSRCTEERSFVCESLRLAKI